MHNRRNMRHEPPGPDDCATAGCDGRHGVPDALPTGKGQKTGCRAPVDLTVIVPTFNEKPNVRPLVEQLTRVLEDRRAEVLFIDDSSDGTPEEIAAVAAGASLPVHLIHRSPGNRGGGLAGAVAAGIQASSSEYVVVMDGDLQHPPTMVPQLCDAAAGADLAVASRYARAGDASGLSSSYRRVVSGGSNLLARTCFPRRVGRVCSDPMTGFFCLRRSAVDLSRLRPRGFKILLEILARHDLRVREIPFSFGERGAGTSKASWRNGLNFVRQIVGLRMGRLSRFAAVGALGTVVNLAVMALLVQGPFDLEYVVASVISTEISILHNYLLQERLVFRDIEDAAHGWHVRLGQQLLFSNVEAVARLPLLMLLVEQLSVNSVLAHGMTIAITFALRFTFATRIVYRMRSDRAARPGLSKIRRARQVAPADRKELAA